ncbi:hypothetical protein GF345_01440 [Candidatus Woesearchaeota archaeon]|nr:hypothetical protein [Candidatus Woesearchaeota archaeon]
MRRIKLIQLEDDDFFEEFSEDTPEDLPEASRPSIGKRSLGLNMFG